MREERRKRKGGGSERGKGGEGKRGEGRRILQFCVDKRLVQIVIVYPSDAWVWWVCHIHVVHVRVKMKFKLKQEKKEENKKRKRREKREKRYRRSGGYRLAGMYSKVILTYTFDCAANLMNCAMLSIYV